jgi:hypothetical protein
VYGSLLVRSWHEFGSLPLNHAGKQNVGEGNTSTTDVRSTYEYSVLGTVLIGLRWCENGIELNHEIYRALSALFLERLLIPGPSLPIKQCGESWLEC